MKKEESKEYKFAKKYSKLSLRNILLQLKIPDTNFYANKVSNEKEIQVKNKIICEFAKLIIEDLENEKE